MKVPTILAAKTGSKVMQIAILATAGIGGVSLVSSSVFASLDATAFNTNAQNISGGLLTITLSPVGNSITGATTTDITKIAPGDVQYRYVDLVQSTGTNAIDGDNSTGNKPTLTVTDGVAADPSNALDANLEVTIDECVSGTWSTPSLTPTATSTCSSNNISPVLGASTVSSLSSAATLALNSVAAGATSHLRVKFQVPASYTEHIANALFPNPTIQNKSAALTFTFFEKQKTPVTTNS